MAELQLEAERLQQKLGLVRVCFFIGPLTRQREGEDAEKIVKRHIKLLHDFNEAKDAAQVCFKFDMLELSPQHRLSTSTLTLDSHWKSKQIDSNTLLTDHS